MKKELIIQDLTPLHNVSFNNKKTDTVLGKALAVQVKEKQLDNYERIVVLGGKNYTVMAEDAFS